MVQGFACVRLGKHLRVPMKPFFVQLPQMSFAEFGVVKYYALLSFPASGSVSYSQYCTFCHPLQLRGRDRLQLLQWRMIFDVHIDEEAARTLQALKLITLTGVLPKKNLFFTSISWEAKKLSHNCKLVNGGCNFWFLKKNKEKADIFETSMQQKFA